MLLAIMGPSLGFDMNKQGALNQHHFCHHNIAIGILHPAGSRNYYPLKVETHSETSDPIDGVIKQLQDRTWKPDESCNGQESKSNII